MERFNEVVGKEGKSYEGFILKDVNLSKRSFEGVMNFSKAEFHGNVNISSTTFQDVAFFKGATFFDKANFRESRFIHETVFTDCDFRNDADFHDTRFDGKAYFKRIRFQTGLFSNAVFGGKCIFSPKQADIQAKPVIPTFHTANFTGSHFEKGGSFDHCIIPLGTFEDSSIQNVSFREVNLDEVRFAGAHMDFAYLSDSEWTLDLHGSQQYQGILHWARVHDPRLVVREEMEARELQTTDGPERVKAFKKAESTYRRIKHSLANEGSYERAGEFYIHEMRMKKERYAITQGAIAKWNFLWNILYSWTCGYGERPKRVFLNAFLVIFIFSLLYTGFNGIQKSSEEDSGEEYDPTFRECLYFSVVTFTTLGYGDYSPKDSFQLIAVLEAFLGAFTMALFVLVFGRKVMR
jgi:uncharacterized protein YjbI with pentapeptide repeats